MSYEYDLYLAEHRANVQRGYEWLRQHLPDWLPDTRELLDEMMRDHDKSKDTPQQYYGYDDYFYGGNRSHKVVMEFKYAWLNHIHHEPHHWQYWILINDDPREKTEVLEMSYVYVIEMICDWWSFSWKNGDLTEIFKWYDEHKTHMQLHSRTRTLVEDFLADLKGVLAEKWEGEKYGTETE